MRNTSIKVGLFVCATILFSTQNTHGISVEKVQLGADPFAYKAVVRTEPSQHKEPAKAVEQALQIEVEPPKAPETVSHTVEPGDSLTKIAQLYNVEWTRLFDKNTAITDPNSINPGQTILIPTNEEQLPKRPLPTPEITPQATPSMGGTRVSARQTSAGVAGNTYSPGYCTWYAKNRRPDLPNRMGNASSWPASAAEQGFATGSTPQVGAIGQQGNHVVYVEVVHGDGTVTVSEMNWSGLFVISTRTVPAGSFTYIY